MADIKSEIITRPSLVIGLGGTGRETIRFLKRRFFETNNGKLPDLVRLLCFDTTEEANESILGQNGNDIVLTSSEFWNLGGYNVDRQVQSIQGMVEYKEILAWFPKELRPGQVDQGAQITRPIGRLSLLLKEKKVRALIREAMKQLHLIWKKRYKDTKESMDVYFISSLCGGTGSGMFIDLPYITEVAADEEKIKSFQRIGILLLPSAFSTSLSSDLMMRAEGNTYAALKELDYFMEQARFDYIPWQGRSKRIEKRPFDACYLMDTTNENELKLENQSSAMQLIAESLFLKISTQIGRAGAQEENNIFGGLGVLGQTASGKLTAYSAFGVAFATYPVDDIVKFCSSRLTKEIVSSIFLNDKVNREALIGEIENYLKGLGLLEDQIIERIMTEDKEGQIEKINVNITTAMFKDYTDVELIGILRNFVESYRRDRISKFNKVMWSRKEKFSALLIESLENKFNELIAESYKGFPGVKLYIEELKNICAGKQDAFIARKDGTDGFKNKVEISERSRERILQQMEEAVKGFHLRKQTNKVQRLRDDFIGELVRGYNIELKMFAATQAAEMMGILINRLNEYIKDVDDTIKKLTLIKENIDDKLSIEADRKNSIEFLLGRSVVTEADVLKLYEKQVVNKEKIAMEFFAHNNNHVQLWKDKVYDVIKEELIRFFGGKFDAFKDYNVEDMLVGNGFGNAAASSNSTSGMNKKGSPAEILLSLYRRATPFWVYDSAIMDPRGNLGEELSEILVVGVEDEEKTIFQGHELPYKINFTSIKDSAKIAIDRNHHGLPLFALWGMESFEGIYDELIAKKVPLHVYKEAEKFPKITRPLVDQQEAEKRELYFILGRIFGIIYKKGLTYLYSVPHPIFGEEEMVEKEIANGLEKTREAVFRDVELVKLIKENADKKVVALGNEEVKKQLLNYMRNNREELNDAERNIIQEYRKQL